MKKKYNIYVDGKKVESYKTLKTATKYANQYKSTFLYRSVLITVTLAN